MADMAHPRSNRHLSGNLSSENPPQAKTVAPPAIPTGRLRRQDGERSDQVDWMGLGKGRGGTDKWTAVLMGDHPNSSCIMAENEI